MAQPPEQLQQALTQFRTDIIAALADLRTEINALESALIAQKQLTPGELSKARVQEQKQRRKLVDRFYEEISPAHELR